MPHTAKTTKPPTEYERYYAPDRASWRRWLSKNHKTARGIWLVFDKMSAN